jgi:hypothetical protein
MTMEPATATELVATTAQTDEGENITDIQNYLQSFNKEIGDQGAGDGAAGSAAGTTFYAIDTSQVSVLVHCVFASPVMPVLAVIIS